MYIAQIDFEIVENVEADSRRSAIYSLLASFLHDGRIGKDYQVSDQGSAIKAFVSIPGEDAFSNFDESPYISEQLKGLAKYKISQPKYKIIGKALDSIEICGCKDSSGYILYTAVAANSISPLYCFDCFNTVPLYWLPRLKSGDFFNVYIWQSDYVSCDSLQMHCRTGERFALKEMLDYKSSLTKAGLEICTEIFHLTGKPVYYFLFKFYGKSLKKELERKCPKCDGDWHLPKQFHRLFDFRCDRCRLLSILAIV